jgi:regulator of cell morphogenesis and NO signaling
MNADLELEHSNRMELLRQLVDAVPGLHHQVLRQRLDAVNRVIQRIAQNHVVPIAAIDPFERQFLAVADQIETNLEEQECWLFAWLRRLVRQGPVAGPPSYLDESLEEAMSQAAAASQKTIQTVSQIQMSLCQPEWTDKGPLVEELIDRLRDLEEALMEYDHLVREELFPCVREMNQSRAEEKEARYAF